MRSGSPDFSDYPRPAGERTATMHDMPNDRTLSPVFVHSWWRTSSTYVWFKLRQNPSLCCYYEPLHEVVGHLTLDLVRFKPSPELFKLANHPVMERDNYAEYEPLILAGGIPFHKELSYDRYFLLPGEADPALEAYLETLIRSAGAANQRPVMAFCRSSLRAASMRRRFGGLHIAIVRNPRDQWGSMLEQASRGGLYFQAGVLAIASRLRTRFPRAFAHLPCALPDHRGRRYNPDELKHYHAMATRERPSNIYAVLVLIWLASALQLLSACDVVIDSDRLSADAQARAGTEARLAREGLPVDFSDYATPRHPRLPLAPDALDSIEAAAIHALSRNARPLAVYHPERINAHLASLAPSNARLVRLALDALRAAPRQAPLAS